jgi:hypothetical protein
MNFRYGLERAKKSKISFSSIQVSKLLREPGNVTKNFANTTRRSLTKIPLILWAKR